MDILTRVTTPAHEEARDLTQELARVLSDPLTAQFVLRHRLPDADREALRRFIESCYHEVGE